MAAQTSKTSEMKYESAANLKEKGKGVNKVGYFHSHVSLSVSSFVCADMASCLLSISPHQAQPPPPPPPPVGDRGRRRAPCQIRQIVSTTAANRRPAQVTMQPTH